MTNKESMGDLDYEEYEYTIINEERDEHWKNVIIKSTLMGNDPEKELLVVTKMDIYEK